MTNSTTVAVSEEESVHVPALLETIASGLAVSSASAAAYSALKQLADSESGDDVPVPILTWAAKLNGRLVEVHTDLGGIPLPQRRQVAEILAAVHLNEMDLAAASMQTAVDRLREATQGGVAALKKETP